MSGEERRQAIVDSLLDSKEPISGTELAKRFDVSRQVIVQDIALIRANKINIYSTHKGYVIEEKSEFERVFKVCHGDDEVKQELDLIVDMGGRVKDVFIYHKVYNLVKADMRINSRRDVEKYMDDLKNGKSTFLKNVTGGYHYHTVVADSEEILDLIQEELSKAGFLARLKDYEPVDFWKK
ncbi:MAG: transcription repressor NadR [Lachnospiraceae bacterium]|nr:transcription repressor NadR [Lachnospiraceae bacterium]